MKKDIALETLRRHVSACRLLDRDITSVLAHLQHPRRHRTSYAVDFSEIYSLLFPEKTADEMRVFDDDDPNVERLVQYDALQRIFFDDAARPVLLPPYALEFRSLISRIRAGLLDDTVVQAQKAVRQIESAVALPEIQALTTLIQQDLSTPADDEETEAQVHRAWEVFQTHASAILLLTQDNSLEPLRRIMNLIESGRFVNPPRGPHGEIKPDESVRDRWFGKLLSLRGRDKGGASYVDATAMATLYSMNRELGESDGSRMVITSRSTAMHSVFEAEYRDGLWNDAGGYVLRHPRTFAALYRRFTNEEELRMDLTLRQLSHQDFLRAAEPRIRRDEPLAPDEADFFLERISAIRADWHQTETLASTGLIETARLTPLKVQTKREQLVLAMKILMNRQAFEELVSRRVSELLVGIERQHDRLNFALQANAGEANEEAALNVQPHTYDDKVVLRSTRYWLPYTLQFTSEELKSWAEALSSSSEVTWDKVGLVLDQGLRNDADYERLLAMSYLLANLDKWAAAEQFCERAILQPQIQLPRNEGHYFIAICMRMHQESPERYHRALEHLDIAQNTKRAWRREPGYEDPRYLTEKGTQIYHWNVDASRHNQEHWKTRRPPRMIEARNLWEKALTLVRNDRALTAQLHNNLCFYYSEVGPFDEQKMRYHLNHLVATQKEIQPDMSKWNPLVLDTVAMARLRLHTIHPDLERLREIADHVRNAMIQTDLAPKQRQTLEENLEKIEKAFRDVSVRAAATNPLP